MAQKKPPGWRVQGVRSVGPMIMCKGEVLIAAGKLSGCVSRWICMLSSPVAHFWGPMIGQAHSWTKAVTAPLEGRTAEYTTEFRDEADWRSIVLCCSSVPNLARSDLCEETASQDSISSRSVLASLGRDAPAPPSLSELAWTVKVASCLTP